MLENRPEDALGLLVETVKTVLTVQTVQTVEIVETEETEETVETVETEETVQTVQTEDLKKYVLVTYRQARDASASEKDKYEVWASEATKV